jgi:hypothetical protein
MRTQRESDASYRRIEKFLEWTGLYRAVKGTPSLLLTILVSVAIMESVVFVTTPLEYQPFAQPFLVLLGLVIGMITVAAGDFWDRKAFDPRYGLRGAWLTSCPWALFPSGSDLKHYRDLAIEELKPISSVINQETGEFVFDESKRLVQKYPRRWDQVVKPLELSKFARNFILPFLSAGILLLAIFLLKAATEEEEAGFAMPIISAAVACLIVAFLLFIPYFKFRIEHMIQLYSETVAILGHKTPT